MLSDVMKHFGFIKEFSKAGYFETEHHKKVIEDIKNSIHRGKIIALSGIVGCGKTTILRQFREKLKHDKDIVVSQSFSIEKNKISVSTLTTALFLDLSTKKNKKSEIKIPSHPEIRIRELIKIIKDKQKPVVLFVDEAHELHGHTLTSLKKLIETINTEGCCLSILLLGHPKLKNDLKRPTLEEIGARSDIYSLDGILSSKRKYIEWLINKCTKPDVQTETIITPEAIDLLADRLLTPLQINQYLSLTFEEAYKIGVKPVTEDIAQSVIVRDIDDIEPVLIRHGYNAKNLSEVLGVKTKTINAFLKGKLSADHLQELQQEMLAVGIPL